MMRLTRREFLSLSTATMTSLWLAACQPIQPPTPAAPEVASPAPALEELSLLDVETQTAIEKVVQFSMDEYIVPGLALGIMHDSQVVYAQGFGVTQTGTSRPVTPQTIFQVMDLTHLFTAAAAMQLVEQGKLDLDAPIVEYLPYFKLADERYTQITMRHLLSESSGLPYTLEATPSRAWEGKTPQTDDEALERYVRSLSDQKLEHDPGGPRLWVVNMGFDVAGDVIAKVSGEIYEEYMHQHILEPLGMHQSTFYPEQVDPDLRVTAHGYKSSDAVVSDLVTTSRERAPSTGLFSNLADLLRWTQANLNRGELEGQRILQDASYDEIWKPQLHLGWGTDQQDEGLGWLLGANHDHPVSHYIATDFGFHGALYLAPQDNVGTVVLGNQYMGYPFHWYAYTCAGIAIELIALQ